MSLAEELKRRLDFDEEPIRKRLKLAENVLRYPLFPITNKGDIVIQWLCDNLENGNDTESLLHTVISLKQCIKLLNFKICSYGTESKLMRVLFKYIQNRDIKLEIDAKETHLNINFFESCLELIENSTINNYFQQNVDQYFNLSCQILQSLLLCSRNNDSKKLENTTEKAGGCIYKKYSKRLMINLHNFVKSFNKRGLLITPFLDSQLIWTILDLICVEDFSTKAFSICQMIVFPQNHVMLFKKYITTIIQGNDLSGLIEESGESLRPIVTVMDILLKKNISTNYNDHRFVNYLDLFLYCYKYDPNLIYLFNIVIYKCLGILDFITVSDKIPIYDVKRDFVKKIHLQNIIFLTKYNIKLDAKYKDINDAENPIKFVYFLQKLTVDLLRNDTVNVLSLSLIKEAFVLDPDILEPVIESILPDVMIRKKFCVEDVDDISTEYDIVMVTVLDNLFKMSRGPEFIDRLLNALRIKFNEYQKSDLDINSEDLFPENFCNVFGKLSSELVSWQHINLFKQLIDYFNDFCIEKLNIGSIDQSIILLTECICTLISSLCYQSKMGDQNIPEAVQNKFHTMFEAFGNESLKKFSDICLNFPNESRLMKSFLKMCQNYGHLKLILWQYQPYYNLDNVDSHMEKLKTTPFHISNVTILHSYMNCGKWKKVFKLISKINDPTCVNLKISLILQNNIAIKIYKVELESDNDLSIIDENIKEYLIQNFDEIWSFLFINDIYVDVTLSELNATEIKTISKTLVDKMLETENVNDVINKITHTKISKELVSGIIIECVRRIWISFDKKKVLKHYASIYESSDAEDFNIKSFLHNLSSAQDYVNKLIECNILKNESMTNEILRLISVLPTEFMNENTQNCVIFTNVILFLTIKENNLDVNILETNIKTVLMKIFELSYKLPNVLDIFSPNLISQLIKNDFFQFNAQLNDSEINLCELFKLLLIGTMSKDTINIANDLIQSIIEDCKTNDNIFDNVSFQAISFAYFTISNLKKSNMTSEVKTVVNKLKEDVLKVFYGKLKKVQWNLPDEDSKDEKSMDVDHVLDSKMTYNNNVAVMNIIESVTLMLDFYYKSSNVKKLEECSELLKFFTNYSLNLITNVDMILPHAKGSCSLINVVLKNYKTSRPVLAPKNQEIFLSNIWTNSRQCLKICNNKIGTGWKEVINIVLENITLLCELCDIKFCNSYLTKELIQFNKGTLEYTDATETKVMQKLWYCFLNANLSVAGKNEARSTIVKQMTKYFFFWLRNIMSLSSWNANIDVNYDAFFDGEFETIADEPADSKSSDLLIVKNLETLKICFEIITEFVTTKKMILSNSLIDTIIQMPTIVNFNIASSQSKTQSFEIFCVLFEKCVILVNALLLNRQEMLQDRWPSFLQAYRKLVSTLCLKSNSEQDLNAETIAKLVKLSNSIERLTETMVKNVKQDISRIAAYIIADNINSFQKVSIYPLVKFHLQNNINCLMQLLDSHAVGFLMRNMSGASRIMFQQFYDNYKKYYKYTGMS